MSHNNYAPILKLVPARKQLFAKKKKDIKGASLQHCVALSHCFLCHADEFKTVRLLCVSSDSPPALLLSNQMTCSNEHKIQSLKPLNRAY